LGKYLDLMRNRCDFICAIRAENRLRLHLRSRQQQNGGDADEAAHYQHNVLLSGATIARDHGYPIA
jgi:hypothetical protein